jgi:hypothetical protein
VGSFKLFGFLLDLFAGESFYRSDGCYRVNEFHNQTIDCLWPHERNNKGRVRVEPRARVEGRDEGWESENGVGDVKGCEGGTCPCVLVGASHENGHRGRVHCDPYAFSSEIPRDGV